MTNIKIGFIGFGSMAMAIAEGLIKLNAVSAHNIYACAKHYDKLKINADKLGISACCDAKTVISNCDIIIPAIVPSIAEEVLKPLSDDLCGKAVVSIMHGILFDKLEELLPGSHHISTLPNTPVKVGEGILICENKHSLSGNELNLFREVFEKIAIIEFVDEKALSVAGTISGCAPAFTAIYIEALADAGVEFGLTRETAYRLASKMIAGTGKLSLESQLHPGMLKDAVCSPGGTTIRGIAALEKNAFRGTVISAIEAIEE